MFESLTNLGSLMKQAMQVKDQMAKVQAELQRQTFEASSGGGMVTARVSGKGDLKDLKISPEAVQPDDVGMLEELVVSAVSAAMKQAQEASKKALAEVTGSLNLPGLEKMLGGGD